LPFIPGGDQASGIFKDLSLRRTSARRFLLCGGAALVLPFAAIEAHAADGRDCGADASRLTRRQGHADRN